jgi:hypothetical protein
MPNPRNTVAFDGIDRLNITFKTSNLSANDAPTGGYPENYGAAVALVAAETVGKGSAGNRLVGQLDIYESDQKASIAVRGCMRFFYSGSAPTVGASVEVDGTGRVRAATSNNVSRDNTVISVDTNEQTVMVRLH